MLSGLKKIAGQAGEGASQVAERDAEEGLLQSTLVLSNSQNTNTSEAEPIQCNNRGDLGVEAFALWPGEMEVAVPENWKVGEKVPAQGPHGRIFLDLPEGCEAGKTLRYRLRPEAELQVKVPPGAKPGGTLMFERPDGTRIGITVPPGKQPGEQFEVTPPALMVLVPEGAQPGDTVIFGTPLAAQGANGEERQWFRAKVSQDLQLGRYFAARLPPPEQLERKGASPRAQANGRARQIEALE